MKGAALASVMGATLATKTSTAERVAAGTDMNALRIVPYANPFRTYPLVNDYEKFKKLVEVSAVRLHQRLQLLQFPGDGPQLVRVSVHAGN